MAKAMRIRRAAALANSAAPMRRLEATAASAAGSGFTGAAGDALAGGAESFEAAGWMSIGRGDLLDQRRRTLGVGHYAHHAQPLESLALDESCRGDAFGDRARRFRRARQDQIGSRYGRHVDADVDAVEKRPGNARLIVVD